MPDELPKELAPAYCNPAASKYCRSTKRFAAGNGVLIVPASPINAITCVNPLRLKLSLLGQNLALGFEIKRQRLFGDGCGRPRGFDDSLSDCFAVCGIANKLER